MWPKVFEKYEQFLKDVRVQPGDDRLELNPIAKPFYARQTAMIRTTAGIADVMLDLHGFNASILPYFGETANDSWAADLPHVSGSSFQHGSTGRGKAWLLC